MEANVRKNSNNSISQFSRALRIKNKVFPPSNEDVVIVKINDEGLGFRFDCYSSSLKPNCPKNLFNTTVKQANKICENVWSENRMDEKAKVLPKANFIFYLAVLISFVGLIILLFYMFLNDDNSLLMGSFLLIWIGSGMVAFVSIYCFLKEEVKKTIEGRILERVGKFLEKENEIYKSLGLQWSLEPEAYWMELRAINKLN